LGPYRFWTPEDISDLYAMVYAGISTEEIADRLGRTEAAVRAKARELRLSLLPIDRPALNPYFGWQQYLLTPACAG
jgi:hypothetical protein